MQEGTAGVFVTVVALVVDAVSENTGSLTHPRPPAHPPTQALLHFSETTEAMTLDMLFREGGDPLLFQSSSNTFAAELIMATMEPKIIGRKEQSPPAAAEGVKRVAGAVDVAAR